jgi:predicted phage baseplate assembly protein
VREQAAPGYGGANRERVEQAAARAALEREATARAITLTDIETLVRELPGARVGRVKAWANTSPHVPEFNASGVVTVVVAPAMPGARPAPSAGLRRMIAAFLARRRVLGTKFEIIGPDYTAIAVHAVVRALPGHAMAAVAERVRLALNTFLDPLRGGKDGLGWPFGRDVYRSEILECIDGVSGVDHVRSIALVPDDGPPQCGNVCISRLALTTPGPHRIEVA